MRPGAEFVTMSHHVGVPTAAPAHGMINGTASPHSPWQSPVPYLFGGLAAMLGLIAFALLILACSYWKLSGYLDGGREGQSAGDADGEKGSVAGDERPTFLAKPAASRAAEVELATAVAPASPSAGDGGQEKKVNEQGSEVSSHLGADSASPSRDHHDAAGQSCDHEHDAASRSHNHHHEHDHESSSTTALQESLQ